MQRKKIFILSILIASLLILSACNLSNNGANVPAGNNDTGNTSPDPTEEPTEEMTEEATEEPTEVMTEEPTEEPTEESTSPPADPMKKPANPTFLVAQTVTDCATDDVAAAGGPILAETFCDRWKTSVLERPFNSSNDTYFGYSDILYARLIADNAWFYGQIETIASGSTSGESLAYAFELDKDFDGRGDILIITVDPSGTDWTKQGVQVWMDADGDLGGNTPIEPDGVVVSNGYEELIYDHGAGDDPDLAWTRLDPDNPNAVQISFAYNEFIEGNPETLHFGWRTWVGLSSDLVPGNFDIVDHFFDDSIFNIDSSCAWVYNGLPRKQPHYCAAIAE